MAGTAKSVHLTVCPKGQPLNAVFRRTFFDAKSYKEFISTDAFKAQYPASDYVLIREVY